MVQCRRILKWTYAYGFYSFQEEGIEGAAPPDKQQQEFFEYTQVFKCIMVGYTFFIGFSSVRCTHTDADADFSS